MQATIRLKIDPRDKASNTDWALIERLIDSDQLFTVELTLAVVEPTAKAKAPASAPAPSPGERSEGLVQELRKMAHKAAAATQPIEARELERLRASVIHGLWRAAARLAGQPLRQAALFPPEPLEQLVARFIPILERVETLQLDGETLLAELDLEFAEVAP